MPEETVTEEETTTEETPKEEPKVESKPATATEIAEAVAKAISRPGMSADQVEAEWVKAETESGKSRQQLMQEDRTIRAAVQQELLPMQEKIGLAAAKEELDEHPELVEEVKAYMSKFPPNVRGNEQAWRDASAIIEKKARREKRLKEPVRETVSEPADKGKVLGGKAKVNPGLSEGGRSTSATTKKKEYPEFEQHTIDRMFGGDAEAYEKYKDKNITAPKKIEVTGENKADKALRGLVRNARG